MKRIDRIYAYIKEKSLTYKVSDLKGRIGLEAARIASDLDILRNNVSMELNTLYRQGKIVKFAGRPVLFFDRETLEALTGTKLTGEAHTLDSVETCLKREQGAVTPFQRLIGANGSLKKQVEQAKAAILYPPDGLHTLIVGQTGVGKTLFAHMMYEYGKAVGKLAPDAPFITFNCADYYNNPQLLVSHIFGHIKGAFTGADSVKSGILEAADHGILFLDEIHRLPPEGQEMIFYFIDTGTFNKLGETARCRRAKVLIIGATTEDPASALTRTFVRRIPNVITILPLTERTMQEKVDIIKLLLAEEAQRIQKPVKISVESVKGLIGSIAYGNVGQLKSNIKLLCAKAFLNGIDHPEYIEIDFKILPAEIKNGLLTLSADRRQLVELNQYVSEALVVMPSGEENHRPVEKRAGEEFNLYRIVEDKVSLLKGEGIDDTLIKQIIAVDVNLYIKSFYHKQDPKLTARERLLKIVDSHLADFAEKINQLVQQSLQREYKERFLYAFSLHLSAFLKRVKNGETLPEFELSCGVDREAPEFQTALKMKECIEKQYRVVVPPNEVEYLALLLSSMMEEEQDDKVVILVAAHGQSTASSMVEVAQKLFGTGEEYLIAMDMPLEVKPQDVLDRIAEKLGKMRCDKGVLLLVDMGSLCNFGTLLMERLPIRVRTLDMVSTPLVLEALRKADIAGTELDAIYDSLVHFKGYDMEFSGTGTPLKEVIVTICSSGKGAAIKLKELVEGILSGVCDRNIAVLPVGAAEMNQALRELAKEYKILATVGMAKPEFDAPFIPLEELIGGDGEARLQRILQLGFKGVQREKSVVVKNLCEESLEKFLTYLNPAKVISVLMEFASVLEQTLQLALSNPVKIRLIVHCGCALERMVVRDGVRFGGDPKAVSSKKIDAVRQAAALFEQHLKIVLTEDEMLQIADMI